MTPAEFRRIALSFDGAEEKQHMGHPDFRVGGRIFATLGYPDARHGTILLSPQDQAFLVRDHPKAFKPAAGAWGKSGSTAVVLRFATRTAVILALEAAWTLRAKNAPPAPGSGVRARARRRR
ncbi:MAG: MmcQ/YjbR family DNA-binding protein [Gemmatimonadota bacterium]|nr:MmcQ/YjbR family DNA-binding protein [Gemmatimonadota bacterium]